MDRFFQRFEPHGSGGPRILEIPVRMLVPNFVTVMAICAGLTGVRLAYEGHFERAVIMVLIAAFLDGIDGRLARALKAASKFGVQMDSLADIVNFGVAPALVVYFFLLQFAKPFGWIAALVYAVACCLRLARFNVLTEDEKQPDWQKDYFVGVPAPLGAALVLLPVYLCFLGLERATWLAWVAAIYTMIVALLLVSRLPIYSGKKWKVGGDKVIPAMLVAVLGLLFLAFYTWQTLSVLALAYLAFIPLSARAYSRRADIEEAKLEEAAARAKAPADKPEAEAPTLPG